MIDLLITTLRGLTKAALLATVAIALQTRLIDLHTALTIARSHS